MANEAVQAAIYKLSYDTQAFQQSADAVTQGNEKVIDSFTRVEAKYDPVIRAELRRQAAIEQATRFLEEGVITEDRYAAHIANVNAAYDAQATAATRTGTAVAQASAVMNNSWSLNRSSLLSLQAAGINAAQALASGMSITRVAMTEGAQVVGALAGGISGGLSIAISAAIAGLSILATNTGIFSSKSKEATDQTDLLKEAHDRLAGSLRRSNDLLIEAAGLASSGAKDYALLAQDVANATLKTEGETYAQMKANTVLQEVKERIAQRGIAFQPSDTLQRMKADLEAQGKLVDSAARNAIDLANNFSAAAIAAQNTADSVAKVTTETKAAATGARQLKNELQEYKDRFNEVMRARVSLSQRLTVMSGNIEDAGKTPPATASKQTTDAFKQQTEQTRQLEQVTQDLTQTIDGLTQSLLVNQNGSINWAQVLLQGINLVSDAIIKLAGVDTGGKGGIGGLLGGLLTSVFSGLFGGGGGAFPGVPSGFAMASGGEGVVDRPTLFLAGEAGRERFSFRPMAMAHDAGGRTVNVRNVFDFRGAMVDEAKIRFEIEKATPAIVDRSVAASSALARRGGHVKESYS